MSQSIVLVICPDCTEGTAPDGLGCVMCSAMGHIAVDRELDGTPPLMHRNGTPVRLWVDESAAIFHPTTDAPEA